MTRYGRRGWAAGGAAGAALMTLACSPAQPPEQENAGGEVAAMRLEIPAAMQREHAELHEELVQATQATGRTGEAAREVARALDPHFEREEEIALPPLGLLQALAAGGVTPEMAAVLPLTDALKAELPSMLEEHAAIVEALEGLAGAASAENQPRYVQLAETIMAHAETEEQVNYPAAILVGEYVRAALGQRGP